MSVNLIPTLLVMALCILMSAYFSATETAFSSLNQARLKTMADKGNRRAAAALAIAGQYDKMLSTILIGNNIVNIAVASLGTLLFVDLLGDIGATVSTLVITVVVLIFGEISPKSLAKESPERFAMFSTPFLRFFLVVLTPVNFLFTQWKKLLSRMFPVNESRHLTSEELLVLVDEVEQEGGIDSSEGQLLRSAIDFPGREAEDILTHRVDMEAIPLTASPEEVDRAFTHSGFSRLPVYEESIDQIVGVLHQKDFYLKGGLTGRPITELLHPPLFVAASTKIDRLLRTLQKNQSHLAIVNDEYGGTLGLITMEDILEELVGEIWDEHDEITADYTRTGEGSYLLSGGMELSKLERYFHLSPQTDSSTVSGWVIDHFGRIPMAGDQFRCDGWLVTISSADQRRVKEVTLCRAVPAAAAGE